MLEGNPFADLVPSGSPGVIMGPPEVPKPIDPLDAEAKRLEIELKKQRIAKGEPLGEGEAKLREAEQKATFLTTNLLGNVNVMQGAIKADPSSTKPTWDQLAVGVLGPDAKNAYLSDQRQVIENSQRLIVDAALTLGTGAAYTPEQIEAYRRGLFPQVGDSEAAIKAKRESLRTALVAARLNAGAGAGKIDEAMKALGFSNDPLDAPATGKATPAGNEGEKPLKEGEFLRDGELWYRDPETGEELPVVVGGSVRPEDRAAEEYRKRQDEAFGKDSATQTMLTSGMTLNLSDEAAGIGTGISKLLTGQNPIEGYKLGRDAERLRIADAREQLGYGALPLEIAGGFLSANPMGAIRPATSALATIAQGAKSGAAVGALAGYGSGEGFTDSAEKGVIGATLGGVLGGTISGVSTRLAPRGMNPELAAAAEAENVRLIRPMIDPASRGKAGSLEATAGGQNVIREGVKGVTDDIERGAVKLGANGQPLESGAAGESIQRAGQRFIQKSKGVADRLYTRARSLAGGARIEPKQALAQADQEIASLSANEGTNAAEIAFLERFKGDLTKPGGKSVEELKELRRSLRGAIDEAGLTGTQAEARAIRILDATHADAAASLPQGAASAYRRADAYYRERMVHIDDILERFIGKNKAGEPRLSGEAAFAKLKSMTSPGGDGRRLAAVWRNLEPQEQADVSATIAQSLGRKAEDAPFSTALFVQQANKLSPSARRTIFGPSGAESVGNLVKLSRSLNEATADFNRSNSGRVTIKAMGQALVAGLLGGGGGALAGGGGTAAATALGGAALIGANAGRNALSARALMSPRVTRWLAEAANVNTPAQAQVAVNRLGTIIAREPALAGELAPLQRMLSDRLNPTSLAASDTVEGEDEQTSQ